MIRAVVFLFAACCISAQAGASPTDNLLRNGDFENQLRYWDTEPHIQWEDSAGLDDSAAMLVQGPYIKFERYIHEVTASQCVQLDDADVLYLEATMRFDRLPKQASGHRINYIWFEDNACSYGGAVWWFLAT